MAESESENIEVNMGGRLDAAFEAAIQSSGLEMPPDEATRAEAMEKARKLIADATVDAEGLQHLKNFHLSMGLPATRALFRQMVAASNIHGADKADVLKAIVDMSPVTEKGCMRIDFHNRVTNKADVAYLRLDACPKAHNLGRQLDRLKALVAEPKWPDVLKSLTYLTMLGRSIYSNIATQHIGLIRKIFRLGEDDKCEQYTSTQVDKSNTTLFLDESWPNRVGIYVSLEADIPPPDEKKKNNK